MFQVTGHVMMSRDSDTCDDARSGCGDSAIVSCSGAYGHQYPWDQEVLTSVRIMWGFMSQYTASDNNMPVS